MYITLGLLDDSGQTDQIVVAMPRLRDIENRANGSEVIEYTLRRTGSIIEQEHDPAVDQGTLLACDDNTSLVVRVVFGKVPESFEDLRSLTRGEEVVTAPYLLAVRNFQRK